MYPLLFHSNDSFGTTYGEWNGVDGHANTFADLRCRFFWPELSPRLLRHKSISRWIIIIGTLRNFNRFIHDHEPGWNAWLRSRYIHATFPFGRRGTVHRSDVIAEQSEWCWVMWMLFFPPCHLIRYVSIRLGNKKGMTEGVGRGRLMLENLTCLLFCRRRRTNRKYIISVIIGAPTANLIRLYFHGHLIDHERAREAKGYLWRRFELVKEIEKENRIRLIVSLTLAPSSSVVAADSPSEFNLRSYKCFSSLISWRHLNRVSPVSAIGERSRERKIEKSANLLRNRKEMRWFSSSLARHISRKHAEECWKC